MNSPVSEPLRQSFFRRSLRIAAATLRLFTRRETYSKTFKAVDFLLSNEIYTFASATAFNVLIAFFPAVIVILTLAAKIGGPDFHETMLDAIIEYVPANKAFFLKVITGVTGKFGTMTLLSLIVLLFSAVGIFVPVELALNYVWKIQQSRHWFVSQLISFGLLFLFIAMALLPTSLTWGFRNGVEFVLFFAKDSAAVDWIVWFFMKVVTLPFTIIAFAITYWVLPARKMQLEEVLPAAIFSGLCFEIGKYIFVFALPLLNLREIYGAFFVSVTFITWALFSSMMLLMGAYLTHQELLPKWKFGRNAPTPQA